MFACWYYIVFFQVRHCTARESPLQATKVSDSHERVRSEKSLENLFYLDTTTATTTGE